MLPGVFRKTLRDLLGPVAAWGIGLAILAVAMVFVFSSVRDNGALQKWDAIVRGLAPAILAFVGGEDIASVAEFEGFMRMELLNFVPAILAIFAVAEGSAAIAREEERRTIDLLMAQPVRRWRVVVEKFAAMAVGAYAIAATTGLGLLIATRVVRVEHPWHRLVLGAANAVPPALVVGALSLLGSCTLRRRLHAAILGGAFLVASFFLNVVGQVADLIRPWRKLSVFYWYTVTPPLSGEIVTPQIVLLAVVAAILVAAAAVAFGRKDLAV